MSIFLCKSLMSRLTSRHSPFWYHSDLPFVVTITFSIECPNCKRSDSSFLFPIPKFSFPINEKGCLQLLQRYLFAKFHNACSHLFPSTRKRLFSVTFSSNAELDSMSARTQSFSPAADHALNQEWINNQIQHYKSNKAERSQVEKDIKEKTRKTCL